MFHAHHVSFLLVSTHSRPKAAGGQRPHRRHSLGVSTHSRPKAAGQNTMLKIYLDIVSTHSRPKAAGRLDGASWAEAECFNTQPPEGGWA